MRLQSAVERIESWQHVFKLDPDKHIDTAMLKEVAESGSDALIIGGTQHIEAESVRVLQQRVRDVAPAAVPIVCELSNGAAAQPGFDLYLLPSVMNSENRAWWIGSHLDAVMAYGEWIPWDRMISEGYLICNRASAVGELATAVVPANGSEIEAYADLAEHVFHWPILYLEYSGRFANMADIHRCRARLTETKLFYGGGIDSPEKAVQAKAAADTIVVGNAIYEHPKAALATVAAVKYAL